MNAGEILGRLVRGAYYLFIFALLTLVLAPVTHAQNANDAFFGCSEVTENQSFGTLDTIPSDTYTVYVQLAKRGQQANVSVYANNETNSGCDPIGNAQAGGDGWARVGIWSSGSTSSRSAQFVLASDQLDNTVDANRPTIMLVSASTPTCSPTPTCSVTIDGRTGTVLPPGNSIASETVRVTRVVPPESDAVKKVRYYVDNKPVYSTDTLRPFDYRYVTSRYQKVDTVIEYASGQRISLAEHIPDTHSDTFFNFLFRGFQTNPQVFTLLGGIAGLLAVGAIILAIVHSIERRHYWRLAHGFIQEKVQKNQQLRSFKDTYRLQKIKKGIGYFLKYGALVTSLLVLAIGINRYVGTLYSVDGISMTNTFHDKAEVLVNRIPVTLAALAGRSYVPQRGEVVIMNAAYGFVHSQTHTEGFIIKRVLGLPGERVVVKDGVITVYTADGIAIQPDSDASWQSTMIATTSAENIDLTLDENELFISGDNRQDSVDSRYNGPITTDQLVGTVVLKLW